MKRKNDQLLNEQAITWRERDFLRAEVPAGDNRGRVFTIAQPLAGRYRVRDFFASGGMGLLLAGQDERTGAHVLIKSILHYDVTAYARVRDQEGFTNQLRLPRKTLEMERRILVLLRNAGCNAVPHPNDFVFDTNPNLAGPYPTDDGQGWTYADLEMLAAEPYLVMEAVEGQTLDEVLTAVREQRLSEARTLRIMSQVVDVLRILHEPRPMKAGMTWQLIYQDLKPANLMISAQDRVTVIDLGGCQLLNLDTGQKLLPGAATPGYCPPECMQPYTSLTPAADVYTVGSNLFHWLTGQSPLDLLRPGLALRAQAVSFDLKLLEGRCRPAVRALIEKCLHPDPGQRYANAGELFKAMKQLENA